MHEESALHHLFGAYLNIDWSDEYSSTDEAVEDFLQNETGAREQLGNELADLLRRDLTGDQLAEHIENRYRPAVAPEGLGLTWRTWLREVLFLIDVYRPDENAAPNK